MLAAVLLLRLVPDPDIQPTNTGMLDSDVLLIILLGLGVMYDLDLILVSHNNGYIRHQLITLFTIIFTNIGGTKYETFNINKNDTLREIFT